MPEMLAVTGLTTYRVTVSLDGESRSYRAAFLWKETGTGLTFQAYDQVTVGLDGAIAETVPAGRRKLDRDASLGDLENLGDESAIFGECIARETFHVYSLGAGDSQGHQSGAHQVGGTLDAICRCNADCSQDCTPNVSGFCAEFGTTDTCHRISPASEDSSAGNAFSATSPSNTAKCGGGVGCAWQACTLCACSPRISVSWNGVGLSVGSFNGTATIKNGRQHTCPACEVVSEDDPSDPPSGGGSGGGGGGDDGGFGGGDSCDPDGDGWVTVEECEFDCGGIADVDEGVCWV